MQYHKKHRNLWPLFYGLALTLFSVYLLLETFVIPRSYAAVQDSSAQPSRAVQNQASDSQGEADGAEMTDSSYQDANISIQITQYRKDGTDLYVADIALSNIQYLQSAFAQNTFGKNITEKTSSIAQRSNAILAINGDYYGVRSGYVIRNGTLYRGTSTREDQQDLVISRDGSFKLILQGDDTAQELLDDGAWQVLSFGPGLIEGGQIAVFADTEVERAKTSNPRTAIGILAPLHYLFVVADGRTERSAGLSLYELAEFMQTLGVQCAYNLDGGGSSTMVFNGAVINNPTTNGSRISERAVSDIVYIG